jgi:hypothetical protein
MEQKINNKQITISPKKYKINGYNTIPQPIPVAAQSKVWVCSCLVAGIMGSNPAEGMDVLCIYVVLSSVGTGLCDGLVTHPEESYCVSLIV